MENKLSKEEKEILRQEEKKDKSVFLEMKRRLKYKGALVEDDETSSDEDDWREENKECEPSTEEDMEEFYKTTIS